MPTDIEMPISDQTYEEIDRFAARTLFHRRSWHRVLSRSFGWRVDAVVARDERGRISYFLPFVKKRRLGRRTRVCLPLSHNVGPLVFNAEPSNLRRDLKSLRPLEIHQAVTGLDQDCNHFVSYLDLARFEDSNEVFSLLHSMIRRNVRKAVKSSLEAVKSTSREHFAAFAELQSMTRRRQGSPTFPRTFFENIRQEFAPTDDAHLHLVFKNGSAVAGVLFRTSGDLAWYGYGASVVDRHILRLGANQLAMWSAIREVFERGCERIDLGSTPVHQVELLRYKERFGGTSEQLHHSYVGRNLATMQAARSGGSIRFASRILQQMPLPLFEAVSPVLMRMVT